MPDYRAAAPQAGKFSPKKPLKLLAATLALLLAACQSNPLGMSDEEWSRLTPEQQMEARMKQADVRRANAERRAAERRHRAELAAEERRRIERLYASSRYGEILECVVEGGIADFRPGWRGYTPAPFTLVRGETKFVSLRENGKGKRKFWTRMSPDGLQVSICARSGRGHGSKYCTTINARSDDFSYGVSRRVTIDDIFRDATLACAFRPGPGMPQRVIHQHNVEIHRVIHVHHHNRRAAHQPRPHDEHPHRDRTVVKKKTVVKHKTVERVIVVPPGHDRAPNTTTRRGRYESPRTGARQDDDRNHHDTPAADPPDDHVYTPTNAPTGHRSRPAPPASDRAREVAAPESAVHANGSTNDAEGASYDCDVAHPSRGRGSAKGRGKSKDRQHRMKCR
jgi:hypothetical protein